jgi:hypothetical protein
MDLCPGVPENGSGEPGSGDKPVGEVSDPNVCGGINCGRLLFEAGSVRFSEGGCFKACGEFGATEPAEWTSLSVFRKEERSLLATGCASNSCILVLVGNMVFSPGAIGSGMSDFPIEQTQSLSMMPTGEIREVLAVPPVFPSTAPDSLNVPETMSCFARKATSLTAWMGDAVWALEPEVSLSDDWPLNCRCDVKTLGGSGFMKARCRSQHSSTARGEPLASGGNDSKEPLRNPTRVGRPNERGRRSCLTIWTASQGG